MATAAKKVEAKGKASEERGRKWYNESGKDAAASAAGQEGTPAESIPQRHSRERQEAFDRHAGERGDVHKRHEKELADMIERQVNEVGPAEPVAAKAEPKAA